jgi:hypothetical protein
MRLRVRTDGDDESELGCRLGASGGNFHILVFRFGSGFAAAEEFFRRVDR